MWEYQCRVENVVDGDTLDLLVDTGFRQRYAARVRLTGVDTAEVYGVSKDSEEYADGIEHAEFVDEWVADSGSAEWPFIVRTRTTGKYGRWLATLERKTDGEVLNEALIVEFPEVEHTP